MSSTTFASTSERTPTRTHTSERSLMLVVHQMPARDRTPGRNQTPGANPMLVVPRCCWAACGLSHPAAPVVAWMRRCIWLVSWLALTQRMRLRAFCSITGPRALLLMGLTSEHCLEFKDRIDLSVCWDDGMDHTLPSLVMILRSLKLLVCF